VGLPAISASACNIHGLVIHLRGRRFRNRAEALSRDGSGEPPDWLRRAVNAGQSVEFFQIGPLRQLAWGGRLVKVDSAFRQGSGQQPVSP
jgi:hypothetical protein